MKMKLMKLNESIIQYKKLLLTWLALPHFIAILSGVLSTAIIDNSIFSVRPINYLVNCYY